MIAIDTNIVVRSLTGDDARQSKKAVELFENNWHDQGLDFADALHLLLSAQCNRFFTFNTEFIRKPKSLSRCSVIEP